MHEKSDIGKCYHRYGQKNFQKLSSAEKKIAYYKFKKNKLSRKSF